MRLSLQELRAGVLTFMLTEPAAYKPVRYRNVVFYSDSGPNICVIYSSYEKVENREEKQEDSEMSKHCEILRLSCEIN